MPPLECGIIIDGIPEGAISRKVGLIWGIPDRHSPLADGQGQSQRDVGPAAVVDGDNAIPVLEVFMAGQFDLLQE